MIAATRTLKQTPLNQVLRRLSTLSLVGGVNGNNSSPPPLLFQTESVVDKLQLPFNNLIFIDLPTHSTTRNLQITLPSLYAVKKLAPALRIEKILQDPLPNVVVPLNLPSTPEKAPKMYASGVLLRRKRRIRLYHRRRRAKIHAVSRMKRHRKKKDAAEKRFRERVNVVIAEAKAFSPRDYVARIVAKGREKPKIIVKHDYEYYRSIFPHWTDNMSVEQLFGLKKSDYIDKKYGLISQEEFEEVKKLRQMYDERYRFVVENNKKENKKND